MNPILSHSPSRDRIREWCVPATIAVAVVALALGGTASGEGLGITAIAVWAAVAGVALARPAELARAPRIFVAAALLLFASAVLTAFSMGWGPDDGAAFEESVRAASYAGAFVLAGLLIRGGEGRRVLGGLLTGLVAVALIALGSRLLGIGAGDAPLVEQLPTATGRLSYPLGYWNALGALMAVAVPLLVHFASDPAIRPFVRRLAFAGFAPVLTAAYMTSSRGGLLAALLAAGLVIARSRSRGSAAGALAVGIAAAVPGVTAVILGTDLLNSPGDGSPGAPELAAVGALLAGVALAAAVGPRSSDRLARIPFPRFELRRRYVVAGGLALIVLLVALAGPSRLVDDFRSFPDERRTDEASGIISASGSGRAQFWGVALEGWAESPVHGLGAGGFATYWNRNNDVGTPTRNAHSEPLEQLAELGLLGFACFAGLVALVGLAALRAARATSAPPEAGAALAALAAGAVGFAIDWTWAVPAVAIPLLILAAAVTAGAFGGVAERPRTARLRVAPAAVGLVAAALVVVWSGSVVATSAAKLDESRELLAAGDAGEAARAAREAIAVEPWAADPYLQLAAVERTVDNVEAAQRATREAIERAPEDFRPWLLASVLAGARQQPETSLNYVVRAYILAPAVLLRLREFAPAVPTG